MIFPTGDGIGATQLACAVMSFARAAGIFSIMTVAEPFEMIPGPAGTQGGSIHGLDISPTLAAAFFPIITVPAPLIIAKGSAGCGTGVGTGAAG